MPPTTANDTKWSDARPGASNGGRGRPPLHYAGVFGREYCVILIRISSHVAGTRSLGMSPLEMKESACLTAHQTEIAISSGGSPTALLLATLTGFSCSIQSTLKISGRSLML